VKTYGKCCDWQRDNIEQSGGFDVLAYIGINMPCWAQEKQAALACWMF